MWLTTLGMFLIFEDKTRTKSKYRSGATCLSRWNFASREYFWFLDYVIASTVYKTMRKDKTISKIAIALKRGASLLYMTSTSAVIRHLTAVCKLVINDLSLKRL